MIENKRFPILLIICAVLLLSASIHAADIKPGKLYVVGMGPAGPDLTAPRALAIVEKADVILCSPRMPQRFEKFGMHIDPSKVAFNPWEGILGKKSRQLRKRDYNAWLLEMEKRVQKVQAFVKEQIDKGQTVVMMDGGDPCVYGPSLQYLLKDFDESLFEVIPGMGAFNAASAALKQTFTPEGVRFVLLTSPESLFGESWEKDDGIVKDLSKYETTMVLYMSLSALERVVQKFKKYYPPGLPVAVVYYAGYDGKEKVLKSHLGTIVQDIKKMNEKWLGLVIMGGCAK